MGRVHNIPSFLGKISPRFHTPANALIGNMVIGILALLSGKTSEIIIVSVFGALTLYIISMISIIILRKREPELHRPFRIRFYPLFPVVALIIASVSIVAMFIFNPKLGLIYFSILLVTFLLYRTFKTADK